MKEYIELYKVVGIFEKACLTALPVAVLLNLLHLIIDPTLGQLSELALFAWLWCEVYERNVLECKEARTKIGGIKL